MKHDEMIAVIQAHKDGKTVEQRRKGCDHGWAERKGPLSLSFNFFTFDYRIKPEPRVLYAWFNSDGVFIGGSTSAMDSSPFTVKTVKFVEVVDE